MTTTQKVQQKLNDSKAMRWTVLIIVSFTTMWGYFLTDAMSPLMTMLEEQMGWTSSEFGTFNWAYCWLNVFLFMLIIGGIILDKKGSRFAGKLACTLMIIGAAIKFYAVENIAPGEEGGTIFGLRTQVFVASLGYAIFAMGTEICGITVTKVIAKWFKGKEMALAMGVQVAVARLGTALAMIVCPIIVANYKMSTPLLFSLALLCVGFIAYLVYCVIDKKFDAQGAVEVSSEEDKFRLADIKYIINNKGFWLIALLCLMFYSAVFPFMKYATSLMENKYHVEGSLAGIIPSLIPLGNLIMTPIFGGIYGRKGKGATLMIIGSVLLTLVHLLFAMPLMNVWWFAIIIMIMLGVAFSLVPSALWPSVPKIIPEKQLGSAYAVIFWVQNIGLGFIPLLIGWVLDKYCIVGTRILETGKEAKLYDYTIPMIIFACFGLIAIYISFLLKKEDKKKGYGLEDIKK